MYRLTYACQGGTGYTRSCLQYRPREQPEARYCEGISRTAAARHALTYS